MIALPEMLVGAAEEAGIPVPPDLDNYKDEDFIRWNLFCNAQLGEPVPYHGVHWENAKIVAAIPEKKLGKITYAELYEMGFQVGYPMP